MAAIFILHDNLKGGVEKGWGSGGPPPGERKFRVLDLSALNGLF